MPLLSVATLIIDICQILIILAAIQTYQVTIQVKIKILMIMIIVEVVSEIVNQEYSSRLIIIHGNL